MRRSDREINDRADQNAILDAAGVMRLAFADAGEPYIVPLNFVRIGDRLYFHSAPDGRKISLVRSGGRVCFEAEGDCQVAVSADACSCSAYYESVVGWGVPALVEDPEEKAAALTALNRKFGVVDGPFPSEHLARTAVARIEISGLTGKAHRPPA